MANRDVIPRWVTVNLSIRYFEQYNVYNDHKCMYGLKCRGTDRVTAVVWEGGSPCRWGRVVPLFRKCVIFVGGNMHFCALCILIMTSKGLVVTSRTKTNRNRVLIRKMCLIFTLL